jgi:PKD repeat protein
LILSFFAGLLMAVSCVEETKVALSAAFGSDTTSALVGDEVTFDDMSLGSPSLWEWTFEGGEPATSNLTQPKVKWMTPGTYTVSLKVSNKDGESEIVKEKMITVNYHPEVTADFSISTTQAFDDEAVTLTNLSKGYPDNIKWTLTPKTGNPIVLTEYSPSQLFPVGEYSVKLEVSNALDTDVKVVENAFKVLDRYAVIAAIGAENTTTYEGGKINFKDASTGNAQFWSWTFEGGNPATSTEQNPVVTYNNVGKYKVSLKTYNDKYESFDEIDGYVTVLPSMDMVFLLPFDGSVTDFGPNGLTPSIYSMGGYELSYGASVNNGGQAIKFPGGTKGAKYSVLQMPDALAKVYPDASEMTMSVWVRFPESISANNAIFAQGDCPGVKAEGNNQIWSRFQTNNQLRCTAETAGMSSNSATSAANKVTFDNGEWHHICIVYSLNNSKRNLSIYANGVEIVNSNGKDEKPTASLPYFIGCNLRFTSGAWAPENMFTGFMDDYVLYKKGFTAAEVKALYDLYK